jgi:hypothetical protein
MRLKDKLYRSGDLGQRWPIPNSWEKAEGEVEKI